MKRVGLLVVAGLALVVVLGAAAIIAVGTAGDRAAQQTGPPPDEQPASADLRAALTPEAVEGHARALQAIAEANGGNRAAGTPGYDASVEYVVELLREAGYEVTLQEFGLPASAGAGAELELADPAVIYARFRDFAPMEFSGTGEVEAPVRPVDFESSTSGCEAEDFAGFRAGDVALVLRGTCTFEQKATNAADAGAAAVLVANSGEPDRTEAVRGTLDEPGTEVPVFGLSSRVGEDLALRAAEGEVAVRVSVAPGGGTTTNVIAESPGGDPEDTVVVGAHLDSTPTGPGINDNASGVGTALEIALQAAELDPDPDNRLRFIFWGGEELGLLGSQHYVDELSEEELDDIAVYLNLDMVGSPNHAHFFYGDRETTGVLDAYFEAQEIPAEENTDLTGRSDHGPFDEEGVPVGGLFSGAGELKTEEQEDLYGGEAEEPYDSCYHQSCDDLSNLDLEAVNDLSDAAAHAVAHFAGADAVAE